MWVGEILVEIVGAVTEGVFELSHWKVQLGCLAVCVLVIAAVLLWVYFA